MNNHMNRCTTFYCDARGDRYCCADCAQRNRCKNPCRNSPERCGLAWKNQKGGKAK